MDIVKNESTDLSEPRKIKPKIITRARLRYSEFKGTFNLGWTFEKKGEAGKPPSLQSVSITSVLGARITYRAKA